MIRSRILMIAASLVLAAGFSAEARQRGARSRGDAAAVVEGVVREVFRSPRRNQVDYLVQIDVRRSELGRGAVDSRRLLVPAPGEPVYVHVSQSGVEGRDANPSEGSSVRAYLSPRAEGGWEGASPDWFEPSNEAFARRGGDDLPPPADDGRGATAPTTAAPGSILQTLGIKADQLDAAGRIVLRLTEVAAGSAAQKAGFEKGDVIIGANGQGFKSLDQFADLLRQGGPVAQLAVLNVQNGQQANVKIEVPGAAAPETQPRPESNRSLGVKVEPRRLGLRTALEVTELEPGGPAQIAGIEKGDVLVEADGVALSDSAQLQKVVDRSGASLTIKVRDSRTGKDVPVEVKLGAADAPRPGGIPTPTPRPTPDAPPAIAGALTSKSFGIAVEAATADLLPVVKVVSVARGSAAEKAGIEVGDAITGVDDKVVFAPDLFEAALGKVGSSFTLTVLDVKTGKKTPVQVNLGR